MSVPLNHSILIAFAQHELITYQKKPRFDSEVFFWRRHPDLNWGVRVLQTLALPLGYDAL